MRVAILAGEASGDHLGAALMVELAEWHFEGVGGAAMMQAGLEPLFPMEELSVMGITEVLPRLPMLLTRIRETADFIIKGRFDALITIDSPDFCFRVAKRVRRAHPKIPIIHYVAPSVWAWRPGRAKKMARFVDHVLCLWPFEPDFMTRAGMQADFVGHPAFSRTPPEALLNWKQNHPKTIALFPGSRRSEIRHNLPVYLAAWEEIFKKHTDHRLVIAAHPSVADQVAHMAKEVGGVRLLPHDTTFEIEKELLLYGADLAVATSGTVTLELACANTPTILCYQTGALNRFLYRRFLSVKYAGLVNILLDREVVPELVFENFTPDNLARLVDQALGDPMFLENQHAGFVQMRQKMTPEISAGAAIRRALGTRALNV